jgi:hypothetical protein
MKFDIFTPQFVEPKNLSKSQLYYMAVFVEGFPFEPEVLSVQYIGPGEEEIDTYLFKPSTVYSEFNDQNLILARGELLNNFFDISGLIEFLIHCKRARELSTRIK